MSAWVLPDHIADVLPSEARHIEEIRRDLVDMARRYGYELVMPPMLEHLESLLSGTGEALDLQTFKLVDQLSGRTLGLRADTTPQVARIDAHLLNRLGVARLCYCGPVLHTRPAGPQATREPLQFGAEIYGHGGIEADLEVLELALDALRSSAVSDLQLDLADVRLVQALFARSHLGQEAQVALHEALAVKDVSRIRALVTACPADIAAGLMALPNLYGDATVLERAQTELPQLPEVAHALSQLAWLSGHMSNVRVSFDLADLRGYAYYTGIRFSVYAKGQADALARGGRYDEVGAVFGRKRAAVGFSLDVKSVAAAAAFKPLRAAIRAPWSEDTSLRAAIAVQRGLGETVVCVLPGHESEVDEFHCDRELRCVDGQWVVQVI